MRRQKQLYRHEPFKGIHGDCHRTALACLLDIPVEECPHFIGEAVERQEWMARGTLLEPLNWQVAQEEWLNERGYTTADIVFDGDGGCRLEDIFGFMQARNPHTYYLLGGRSPRGTNHTVVCCGAGFEWDPHPDGGSGE